MKAVLLVNPGLESFASQELKELIQAESVIHPSLLEFDATPDQLAVLARYCQSGRRLLLSVGSFLDQDLDATWPSFPWEKIIPFHSRLKVEVENVEGQENRFSLAKRVMGNVFEILESLQIPASIDLKRPNLLLVLFRCEKKYYLGVDLGGTELNARASRLFPHSASFKGDLAYALVRASGVTPSENVLIGFVRDGALALEAAFFIYHRPCRDPSKDNHSWLKFPLFQKISAAPLLENTAKTNAIPLPIHAFDESKPCWIASQKNARLSGAATYLSISRYALDELDTRYGEHAFDRAIFHLTSKDEHKINELYYQLKYILKPQGKVLLISRADWRPPESSTLKQISESTLPRGGGEIRLTLLEKR